MTNNTKKCGSIWAPIYLATTIVKEARSALKPVRLKRTYAKISFKLNKHRILTLVL